MELVHEMAEERSGELLGRGVQPFEPVALTESISVVFAGGSSLLVVVVANCRTFCTITIFV